MINLIWDGNYLFRKTFAIFRGFGPTQKLPQEVLASEKQRGQFIRKVTTDFASALDNLPRGGKVVIVFDRKSWRKEFYDGYKAGRERNPEEDWSRFFDMITEYSAILEDKGFIISAVDGAEGDDLIFKWTEHFTSIGESSIIVTGDGDMSQLIKGIGIPFVICWDNNSKKLSLFTEMGWKFNWLGAEEKSTSLFDLDFASTDAKSSLRSLLNRTKLVEMNPDDVIFEKILSGDDGDSVPSVWTKGKTRITGKKTEKIMEAFKSVYPQRLKEWWNMEDALDHLAGLILRVIGDVDGTNERTKVIENLKRNAALVWLTDEMIPSYLKDDMNAHLKRKIDVSGFPKGLKRQFILDGTKYTFTGAGTENQDAPRAFNPLDLLK
jgi:5'-3' exonuclease